MGIEKACLELNVLAPLEMVLQMTPELGWIDFHDCRGQLLNHNNQPALCG